MQLRKLMSAWRSSNRRASILNCFQMQWRRFGHALWHRMMSVRTSTNLDTVPKCLDQWCSLNNVFAYMFGSSSYSSLPNYVRTTVCMQNLQHYYMHKDFTIYSTKPRPTGYYACSTYGLHEVSKFPIVYSSHPPRKLLLGAVTHVEAIDFKFRPQF